MSDFEKEDLDCINIQRQHGPGGELPTISPTKAKKPKKSKEEIKDAKWEPAKPEPNESDKLKRGAIQIVLIALISVIVFWWQQSGRLDSVTAYWTLIVLGIIGGVDIGWAFVR